MVKKKKCRKAQSGNTLIRVKSHLFKTQIRQSLLQSKLDLLQNSIIFALAAAGKGVDIFNRFLLFFISLSTFIYNNGFCYFFLACLSSKATNSRRSKLNSCEKLKAQQHQQSLFCLFPLTPVGEPIPQLENH